LFHSPVLSGDGNIKIPILLTRRQYISYSGLQKAPTTRRSLQPWVVPLQKAATPRWRILEAPISLILISKANACLPADGVIKTCFRMTKAAF
jgi:hypothetical protein